MNINNISRPLLITIMFDLIVLGLMMTPEAFGLIGLIALSAMVIGLVVIAVRD